jgi:hypothetical protein
MVAFALPRSRCTNPTDSSGMRETTSKRDLEVEIVCVAAMKRRELGWSRMSVSFFMRFAPRIIVGAALASVGGCGILPVAGPESTDINSGTSQSGPQYALVKLTADVVRQLEDYGPATIVAAFGDKRPPPEIR